MVGALSAEILFVDESSRQQCSHSRIMKGSHSPSDEDDDDDNKPLIKTDPPKLSTFTYTSWELRTHGRSSGYLAPLSANIVHAWASRQARPIANSWFRERQKASGRATYLKWVLRWRTEWVMPWRIDHVTSRSEKLLWWHDRVSVQAWFLGTGSTVLEWGICSVSIAVMLSFMLHNS